MPAFDRLSPNFIKNFLGRIKHPRNFLLANVAESDGILSVLRPFNEGECRKDGEDGFYNKELFNYGFEISPIPIRFGRCFTSDIGHEIDNLRPKNPLIITDKNVEKTRAMKEVSQSLLLKTHITYDIYDKVTCEPTDKSLKDAIQHVRSKKYDCFIAVGGGSVMDTARIVNLFASNPNLDIDDLLKHQIIDFKNEKYLHHLINTHGKHTSSGNPVYPLISIPTTISLGSESAGGLNFRVQEKNCMATICADAVKPNLILADPLNVLTMPKHVATYGAFDVLIHALESFTIKAFTPHISNMPNVTSSELQTVFRTSNYISDIWSMETLQIMHKYLNRAILEPEDVEAKSQLMMAAAFSGMGFRNPLIRFCHTLSYPIRVLGKHYADSDYAKTSPLIPHGLAVAMIAPVAFMFSAYADPQRHLEAVKVLGADVQYKASSQQIGHALADVLRGYIKEFQLPNGLSELGFKSEDLYKLAELAVESFKPAASTSKELDKEILREIYEEIWKIY